MSFVTPDQGAKSSAALLSQLIIFRFKEMTLTHCTAQNLYFPPMKLPRFMTSVYTSKMNDYEFLVLKCLEGMDFSENTSCIV